MALSDKKKVQTMINKTANEIIAIRAAITRMKAIRTTFNTINPSVTGTPLEGNLNALNNALNALDNAVNTGANNTIWNGLVAAHIDSHTGEAL